MLVFLLQAKFAVSASQALHAVQQVKVVRASQLVQDCKGLPDCLQAINAVILNHDSKNNSSSSFSCSETDTKPFNSTACFNWRVVLREQITNNFQEPSSWKLACRNVSVSKLRHHQFYIVIISFQFMQSFKAL